MENANIDNAGENIENIDNPDAAAGNEPEDTAGEYRHIVDRQAEQIDKLIAANGSLMKQIGVLLRNGANVTDGNAGNADKTEPDTPESPIPDYVPMKDLGKLIDKKE